MFFPVGILLNLFQILKHDELVFRNNDLNEPSI